MKIGLFTWFDNENYGSALQAYALKRILQNYGSCTIVPYKTQHGGNKYLHFLLANNLLDTYRIISDKVTKILNPSIKKDLACKRTRFVSFIRNELNIESTILKEYELKDYVTRFNRVVCGSDQIWNPCKYDPNFLLACVPSEICKIAYAPSFGVSKLCIEDEILDSYKRYISRFDFLSSREPEGVSIIKEIACRESKLVCDPCALFDMDQWNEIIGIERYDTDSYVLSLFLTPNSRYLDKSVKISGKLQAEPRLLAYNCCDYLTNIRLEKNLGPFDFIKAIRDAKFVCTDSFHATLFAILFHKPFITFSRFSQKSLYSQNSRIHNLLQSTNLLDRLDADINDPQIATCDFVNADKYFENARKESLNYLENAICYGKKL